MKDWNKINLGELISSKNDKSKQLKSSEYLTLGLYPIIDQSEKFICGYSEEKSKVIFNDLPLTVFGDHTRHTKFVDFPFICGADGTQLIKPKGEIDDKFFYYLILNSSNLIGNFGYDRHFKHLKEFEVSYPEDKPEQTRIAEILSTADEAIAHTEALIAKYQRIKTGLMQDLLTKGIDENGNIRSKETHRFVVKNGIEVPEEWEVETIGSFLEGIEQGWSPNCEGDSAPTDEWGVLKTTSVIWDGFNEIENKKLPENLHPKTQYEIKNGDVLITRAANSRVGVVAYVRQTRPKLILCDKIYRLVPKCDIYPEFLSLAISSSYTQRHLSNLKTGMAESQTNISQKIVKSLLMLKPPYNEQLEIIGALSKISENINELQENYKKLLFLKAGLMQDLLSGKVRVNI